VKYPVGDGRKLYHLTLLYGDMGWVVKGELISIDIVTLCATHF